MMKSWHAERTWWMDRLKLTGERLPDVLERHNRQKLKAFPCGPELRAQASFFLE